MYQIIPRRSGNVLRELGALAGDVALLLAFVASLALVRVTTRCDGLIGNSGSGGREAILGHVVEPAAAEALNGREG